MSSQIKMSVKPLLFLFRGFPPLPSIPTRLPYESMAITSSTAAFSGFRTKAWWMSTKRAFPMGIRTDYGRLRGVLRTISPILQERRVPVALDFDDEGLGGRVSRVGNGNRTPEFDYICGIEKISKVVGP